jgi:hypothetical protein
MGDRRVGQLAGASHSYLIKVLTTGKQPGRSVSTVSDYKLDKWGSVPNKSREFSSSPCMLNGSGAHPASFTVGTVGPLPGDKALPGREANHSLPASAEVMKE